MFKLLKRTKDDLGIGLQTVWQMIDSLNKIVGDTPLQGPSFGDWSLREVVALANLGQTAGGYSLRALARSSSELSRLTLPITSGHGRYVENLTNELSNPRAGLTAVLR